MLYNIFVQADKSWTITVYFNYLTRKDGFMALSRLFIQPFAYAHPKSIKNKCLVDIKLDKNIKTLDNNPHYRLLISYYE